MSALQTVHFIELEFDGYLDWVRVGFICKAAPDAPCRMVCAQECEECDHPRTQQVDYCNEREFIENGGEGAISQADKQDVLTLPVDTSWNGDTYVWKVQPATPVASRERIAEVIREAMSFEPGHAHGHSLTQQANRAAHRLFEAGVFRDEAEVKAEARQQAARSIRDEAVDEAVDGQIAVTAVIRMCEETGR
jgi:hypothetical protein